MAKYRFDVFGREVLILRKQDRWSAYYVGTDGKRRSAKDIVIPTSVEEADLEQYLGCSSIYFDYNSWVPLAANSIPDYGYCYLKSTFENLATLETEFVLILEIASEDYIYGRTPNYDILRS